MPRDVLGDMIKAWRFVSSARITPPFFAKANNANSPRCWLVNLTKSQCLQYLAFADHDIPSKANLIPLNKIKIGRLSVQAIQPRE